MRSYEEVIQLLERETHEPTHMSNYGQATKMSEEHHDRIHAEDHKVTPADIPGNPEVIWHKWIGDGRDNFTISSHILCWGMSGIEPVDDDECWHVTIPEENVTCQMCLEWLHA